MRPIAQLALPAACDPSALLFANLRSKELNDGSSSSASAAAASADIVAPAALAATDAQLVRTPSDSHSSQAGGLAAGGWAVMVTASEDAVQPRAGRHHSVDLSAASSPTSPKGAIGFGGIGRTGSMTLLPVLSGGGMELHSMRSSLGVHLDDGADGLGARMWSPSPQPYFDANDPDAAFAYAAAAAYAMAAEEKSRSRHVSSIRLLHSQRSHAQRGGGEGGGQRALLMDDMPSTLREDTSSS
jgi:hypothetical protein